VGSGVVVEGCAVGDGDGNRDGLGVGIEVVGSLVGEGVGIVEGLCDGERVGDFVGKVVGNSVGEDVGPGEGANVGPEVFAQNSKYVTVMLTSLPKSTQCPTQPSKPMLCHKTLSGILVEKAESSYARTVPSVFVKIHR